MWGENDEAGPLPDKSTRNGEELLAVVKGSPVKTVETKEMATLDKCLNDFK